MLYQPIALIGRPASIKRSRATLLLQPNKHCFIAVRNIRRKGVELRSTALRATL
ncbi:hypothetical protein HMPREF1555_01693 [Porphyromonas gingivalis F0570]|uniref:Uncharacterized protein n=1 Tax=Porphyromonas gingivalis F0570 TaxID=1227271 RepID=A0A0E2LPA3_PORGN|nr:hypothetical protein HMPREF1555_01693 [Porphyromonas gingivalis F0570]